MRIDPNIAHRERVLRAQQGDETAIREIYERYQAGIFRYLYYRLEDPHAAEDLTSEVFIRMIRSLSEYRSGVGSFQGWLYRIAHNLAIDHHRKWSSKASVPLEEELMTAEDDPVQSVDHRLTRERLQKALLALNEAQREVVILRFVNELPIEQVAQALKKSEDAVKGLQRRGLMALRLSLNDLEVTNV
jgi:RNA polymerase sigma-70 factor (ECF subfamily)